MKDDYGGMAGFDWKTARFEAAEHEIKQLRDTITALRKDADEGPVDRGFRPRAWLIEHFPPAGAEHELALEFPADEAYATAQMQPLYTRGALDAAVSAERERCAKLCDDLDNDENSGEYRIAANLAARRIRGP